MNELQVVTESGIQAFSSQDNFISAQRMAISLAASDIVPDVYKGKVANCLIALEMSARLNVSIMVIMLNVNIIYGKPSFSSTYIISAINSCGRFGSLLLFETITASNPVVYAGKNIQDLCCRAYTTEKSTGQSVYGPWVTVSMAIAEGWYGKKGSKWPNMTSLMLMYRSASFFGRLYCSDVIMGMQSDDEVYDSKPNVQHITNDVDDIARGVEYLNAADSYENLKARFKNLPPVLQNSPEINLLKNSLKLKFEKPSSDSAEFTNYTEVV